MDFLTGWALVGFIERFGHSLLGPRISNMLFPRDMLFIQWLLTMTAAFVFILDYNLQWQNTPVAMACVNAAMATLCTVETFAYMESDSRFYCNGNRVFNICRNTYVLIQVSYIS
jgi:hypothetical protein